MTNIELLNSLRCRACDKILSDEESRSKCETTGEYEDMCFHCQSLSADENYIKWLSDDHKDEMKEGENLL